jgi:hypothetical protein
VISTITLDSGERYPLSLFHSSAASSLADADRADAAVWRLADPITAADNSDAAAWQPIPEVDTPKRIASRAKGSKLLVCASPPEPERRMHADMNNAKGWEAASLNTDETISTSSRSTSASDVDSDSSEDAPPIHVLTPKGTKRSVCFVDEAIGGQLEEVFEFELRQLPRFDLDLDLDNDVDGAMGSDIVSALLQRLDLDDQ